MLDTPNLPNMQNAKKAAVALEVLLTGTDQVKTVETK